MKKPKTSVPLVHKLLNNGDTRGIESDTITTEVLAGLVQYDRLAAGKLDDLGYVALTEKLVTAFYLAKLLHEYGGKTINKLTTEFSKDFTDAVEAVSNIGVRKKEKKTNSFIGSGDELRIMSRVIALYEFFLPMASIGNLRIAREQASNLIEQNLLANYKRQTCK